MTSVVRHTHARGSGAIGAPVGSDLRVAPSQETHATLASVRLRVLSAHSASIEVGRRGLGDVDDAWRLLGLVGGGDGDHLLAALDQRTAVEVGHLGVGVGVGVVG